MKLSTRSRYGMRLMLDLALKSGGGSVFLKDIAREEQISEKYLSLIIIPLKSAGLVRSTRGAHGGYTLGRPAEEINLKEIVTVLEGEICLVDCVKDSGICSRASICASRDLWETLSETIAETLELVTLADLARKSAAKKLKAAAAEQD